MIPGAEAFAGADTVFVASASRTYAVVGAMLTLLTLVRPVPVYVPPPSDMLGIEFVVALTSTTPLVNHRT